MKKSLIISTSLCLFLGTTLVAQNSTGDTDSPKFGFKIGMNSSNVWDEEGQDFEADSKIGFVGGAFLGIPLGNFLGFQPEVLVSQKGFQGSGRMFGTNYSFARTTTYLDIPLQLQIRPVEIITFVLGPQYSYLMHQKDVFHFGSNSAEQEQEFDNNNIRKNTLGFVSGVDFNFSKVVVSGRAGWDFQTNHGDGSSSAPRYKNQWLQLTIGFAL